MDGVMNGFSLHIEPPSYYASYNSWHLMILHSAKPTFRPQLLIYVMKPLICSLQLYFLTLTDSKYNWCSKEKIMNKNLLCLILQIYCYKSILEKKSIWWFLFSICLFSNRPSLYFCKWTVTLVSFTFRIHIVWFLLNCYSNKRVG